MTKAMTQLATVPAMHYDPVPDGGTDVLTADGGIIRIRPARPADADGLTALHERASDESLYRRFMSVGHNAIAGEVRRLVRPADGDHVALVAVEHGAIVGAASYELLHDRSTAEFAAFVDDNAHHRGIGTLLLEQLAVQARRHGIADLLGEVLPVNTPMLSVARSLAPTARHSYQTGVVDVHVPTGPSETDAIDQRDVAASRQSLTALFAPACVAVVGAGRDPGGIGHAVLRSIVDGGYTGALYAVNPHVDAVAGVPAFATLGALPQRADLIVVAVPAAAVAGVLTDAAAVGVRAAVVISSGFGEEGAAGQERQRDIVRIARATGMRLVGPNCLGVLNTDPAVRLRAMFAAGAPAGGLAVASQSGAVGISLLGQATRTGLGISSFVSLGNKADVSGNDVLSYWYDDPAAKAVGIYLESLGNPRRFARIARLVGRRKPVLAVKSGRTQSGARAGASHTAAAAAPDATIDALFAQAGVVRCDGLGDMMDTARMLVDQPLPAGGRIGIVGNAGGINVLCADAADAAGLSVPELPGPVREAMLAAAPAAAAVANPVDLGAAASGEAIAAAIGAMADHVDAIVVAFGATLAADADRIVAAIGSAVDTVTVPVAVVLLGVPDTPSLLGTRRAPVFELPERAIAALARSARYAAWRAQPVGRRPSLPDVEPRRARCLVTTALETGGGWQTSNVSAALLACYGIDVVGQREVAGAEAAVAAAEDLGYPVVVKSAAPEVVHKTDIGGVRLGLATADAVWDAYRAVAAACGDRRVLVQRQSPPGVDLVAGLVHDPLFGSLLMCGVGGIHTDLLDDRAVRLLPLTDRDAAGMWRTLRAAPLLTGFRGAPPADTAAVEQLLLRLGRLAEDLPEVAELDLNPIVVHPRGLDVIDVKVRLAPVGDELDADLRMLREPR
jgi:acyl-CoA synthetase (NDP forming)/GNAT superfamily N-acetyltransferase